MAAKNKIAIEVKSSSPIEANMKATALEYIGNHFKAEDLTNMVKLLKHPLKGIAAKNGLIAKINENI